MTKSSLELARKLHEGSLQFISNADTHRMLKSLGCKDVSRTVKKGNGRPGKGYGNMTFYRHPALGEEITLSVPKFDTMRDEILERIKEFVDTIIVAQPDILDSPGAVLAGGGWRECVGAGNTNVHER